jgi:hypothetical protein
MTMINTMIQKALGVDVAEEQQPEPTVLPVLVEPHEMPVPVDNGDLPNMADIERRQVEGEKQLEELITMGKAILDDFYKDELPNADPKMKRGIMEQIQMMFANTLAAVKHKNDLQLEKKKSRLADAAFTKKGAAQGGAQVTNNFFGTQEQMRDAIKQLGFIEEEK